MPRMTGVSHETVLQQVRKNILTELLDGAKGDIRTRNELFEFLAFESAAVDADVYRRLASLESTKTLVGRVRVPTLSIENVRPVLSGWSSTNPVRFLYRYITQWFWYFYVRMFVAGLRRCVWMHDEIRAFQLVDLKVDSQKLGE